MSLEASSNKNKNPSLDALLKYQDCLGEGRPVLLLEELSWGSSLFLGDALKAPCSITARHGSLTWDQEPTA